MTKHKISFCTVSMNRLHHLKLTLQKNILDNIGYKNLEFVLLDYSSTDDIAEWVKTELNEYSQTGLLKFYQHAGAELFDRSHSRNMAFRLASGEILCNVDADNFLGAGFANYINKIFTKNDGSGESNFFLTPEYTYRDVIGRLVIKKSDFESSKGYNESMKGYGFEDLELYDRLCKDKFSQIKFSEQKFLTAINHSNSERFTNEFIGRNCLSIYLSYKDPSKTEILYLFKDGFLEWGTLYDTDDDLEQISTKMGSEKILLIQGWKKCSWTHSPNIFQVTDDNLKIINFNVIEDGLILHQCSEEAIYYKVTSDNLSDQLKLLKCEIDNREIWKKNINLGEEKINLNGFGNGTVTRNFGEKVITLSSW